VVDLRPSGCLRVDGDATVCFTIHMCVETRDDSRLEADLVDVWEFPHPDPRGSSETPAEANVDGRRSCQATSNVTLNQLIH